MKILEIYNVLFKMASGMESAANARIATGIFMRNKIISFGFNCKKTHPFQSRFGKNAECIYLHSEIAAIKNALKEIDVDDFKKCNIYICRVKKNMPKGYFIPGLAKPCTGCQRALRTFELKNVYYSQDEKEGFVCL